VDAQRASNARSLLMTSSTEAIDTTIVRASSRAARHAADRYGNERDAYFQDAGLCSGLQ